MITTHSNQEGVTFLHDGDPEGGELHIVVDPEKVKVEMDTFNGKQFLTVTVEYNTIRDLVLQKLARREITRIEKMDGDQLAAYYTGDWTKLDESQGR